MTTLRLSSPFKRNKGIKKNLSPFSYLLLGFMGFVSLFPFYWMVTTSLKTQVVALQDPPAWIFTPTLANYWEVLFEDRVGVSLINSIIVAVCTTTLAVVLGTPAAYALARHSGRDANQIAAVMGFGALGDVLLETHGLTIGALAFATLISAWSGQFVNAWLGKSELYGQLSFILIPLPVILIAIIGMFAKQEDKLWQRTGKKWVAIAGGIAVFVFTCTLVLTYDFYLVNLI